MGAANRWLPASLLGAVWAAMSSGGCVAVGAFGCAEDDQCDAAIGARCFDGACATPDDECSGGYRFAADAPLDRRGSCVQLDPGTSTMTMPDSTSSGSSSTTSSVSTGSSSDSTSTSTSSDTTTVAETGSDTESSSSTGCGPLGCTCTASMTVGYQYNCVTRSAADVVCWGRNHYGQAGVVGEGIGQLNDPSVVEGPTDITEVNARFEHTCALDDEGHVWCWGRNFSGTVDPQEESTGEVGPAMVDGIEDAVSIRLGWRSSCARLPDDTLACWGSNTYGQLLTDMGGRGPHITGPHLEGLVDFHQGLHHGCMWSDTVVQCWGRNNLGQLAVPAATNQSSSPIEIELPLPPRSVAVGSNHGCAALNDGSVYCWGDNEYNQISLEGPTVYRTPNLIEPTWTGEVVKLLGMNRATCALTDQDELWCWGHNFAEYLGVVGGVNNEPFWPPARITVLDELPDPFVDVQMGFQHMCALLDTGSVHCWGNPVVGQIGPMLPDNGMESIEVQPCDAR